LLSTMFRRFLAGFISCFPFVSNASGNVKYFPREIYVNSWRAIGTSLRQSLLKTNDEDDNE
jgi:hypothetical protein